MNSRPVVEQESSLCTEPKVDQEKHGNASCSNLMTDEFESRAEAAARQAIAEDRYPFPICEECQDVVVELLKCVYWKEFTIGLSASRSMELAAQRILLQRWLVRHRAEKTDKH